MLAEGETLELGLSEVEGLSEREALEDGDTEALGLRLTLLDGEILAEGELEILELGLTLAEGEREAEGDIDVLELGDRLELGDNDSEAEALGLDEELGLREELGETELEGETEAETLALTEALGDVEALGLRDTLKDCMQISQFSLVEPLTFLNSNISPKTLPAGWGPLRTKLGTGRTVPSCSSQTLSEVLSPRIPVLPSSRAVITPLIWSLI